ncbi:DUF5339 domain-containing protein, partial [Providencia heimbachae]|uniref:DUF5339 domain-containing protein n=1 Tax=Providencia heimbachae TaxID=333962 RepID=UPI00224024E8
GMGVWALTITACSDEEKKGEVAGATETCNTYFAEVDSLITKASENPQAKAQLDAMKGQLEEGKKQVAALPKDQQDKACQQGIDAMKQMKTALGLQ